MRMAKIIFSIITIIFALLGLTGVLPFNISNPIMLTSLAVMLLLSAIEYKQKRVNIGFVLIMAAVVFILFVVVYNVLL